MGGSEREGGICILICAPSQFPADTAESADPTVTSFTSHSCFEAANFVTKTAVQSVRSAK